ncbi:MAG TPA: hypothetical protein VGG98_03785 [Solirubrobacteraceae bacterium]|jgi:hypothetical protein
MLVFRRTYPALVLALSTLSVLMYGCVSANSAAAAGPATVTVRVIGSNDQPLLPLTQVTTTTAPVVKDGKSEDSCTGTSAAGALELATKGNWNGNWSSSFGYGVETIDGVSYPFTQPNYWTFWLNNKSSEVGVCGADLGQGDSVLFFVSCFSETVGVCPPAPSVLAIETPATVDAEAPTTVTVLAYPNAGGEPKPAVGAIVTGGGIGAASPTNSRGQTIVTLSSDGTETLRANGSAGESSSIPGEAFVCVHKGNDGTCGTPAPGTSTGVKSPTGGGGTVPAGSQAKIELAKIAGVKNGLTFSRRSAPRLLSGSVEVPVGDSLSKVQISLKRRHHARCYGFDGSRVRFIPIRCGKAASWFSVGAKASFSYLLPARLPAGRYVYEIEAVDGIGHTTTPISGVSHVVFRVK